MKRRYTIATALTAAVALAVLAPASAWAGSSLYANAAYASFNQTWTSSLIYYTNHAEAQVGGTLPTIHQQVLDSANNFVVGNSGGGGYKIVVDYATLTLGKGACWWNWGTYISGTLPLTCSIQQIINASPVKPASSTTSTQGSSQSAAAAVPAGPGGAKAIPTVDQNILVGEGADLSTVNYLGHVESSEVWSVAKTNGDQCLVAVLPNEVMGSACGTAAQYAANGVSMQFGTSKTKAPAKMYLLPNAGASASTAAAANPDLAAGIAATTSSSVFLTVAGNDNAAHVFTSATGKKIHLHDYEDWVQAYAGH